MVNLTLETGENDIAINYASGTGTSNLLSIILLARDIHRMI